MLPPVGQCLVLLLLHAVEIARSKSRGIELANSIYKSPDFVNSAY